MNFIFDTFDAKWNFLFMTVAVLGYIMYPLWRKRQHFVRTINKIPGVHPKLLVGNAIEMGLFTKAPPGVNHVVLLIEKMRGIMRLTGGEKGISRSWLFWYANVNIFSPEAVEEVVNNPKFIDKSPEYVYMQPWLGTGLLTSSSAKWKPRRKLLTPAFHFRILNDFQHVFNEMSNIFVNKLTHLSNEPFVDIVPLSALFTLDVICKSAMGVEIHAQKNVDSEYVQAVKIVSESITNRGMRPWLWPDFIFNASKSGKIFSRNLNVLHTHTRNVIRERKRAILQEKQRGTTENEEESLRTTKDENVLGKRVLRSFLDILLEEHLKGTSLSEDDIQEEVDTFMFEGHDTTAFAISWALYLLGLHPDIQLKVQEELDGIFGNDTNRLITVEDLKEMQYLERVIKESQRIYPSVPLIGRIATDNNQIGGYEIPKGTTLWISILDLHINVKSYPVPERFDPDRFLPEKLNKRHPYAFIPFSAGPRNCIGQRFALQEEKTALANILRKLNVHSLDPRDKILIVSELILRPTHPLRLKFSKRFSK